MDRKETLQRFEETVNTYQLALEEVSHEQLLWQPAQDEWSLGQMYMHLIGSAQFMQLPNIRLCLELGGSPELAEVPKSAQGEDLLRNGGFPPVRIKVPASPQYTPGQPQSKTQLIAGLQETLRQMSEIEPAVAAAFAPSETVQQEQDKRHIHRTVAHPSLGGLNALEWFRLIEMHYRHHLHQKKRLEEAWRERLA